MNLLGKATSFNAVGGLVLHISAIGSFLGAVSTSLLFMNYFGVANTVIFNSILLSLAAILIMPQRKKIEMVVMFTAITIIAGLSMQQIQHNAGLIHETSYSTYFIRDNYVLDNKKGKIFIINRSASSFLEHETLNGFTYIEHIKNIIFNLLQYHNKDILVLGAGGFSLSAAGDNGNRFTYVDIDSKIKDVVEIHLLNKINGAFVAKDARVFLQQSIHKYDVIVGDTYSHQTSIPAHLATREFFTLVKNRLNANGIAIFNIILDPLLRDRYSIILDNTLRSVFPSCRAMPLQLADKPVNVLYICDNTANNHIFTDDHQQIIF